MTPEPLDQPAVSLADLQTAGRQVQEKSGASHKVSMCLYSTLLRELSSSKAYTIALEQCQNETAVVCETAHRLKNILLQNALLLCKTGSTKQAPHCFGRASQSQRTAAGALLVQQRRLCGPLESLPHRLLSLSSDLPRKPDLPWLPEWRQR